MSRSKTCPPLQNEGYRFSRNRYFLCGLSIQGFTILAGKQNYFEEILIFVSLKNYRTSGDVSNAVKSKTVKPQKQGPMADNRFTEIQTVKEKMIWTAVHTMVWPIIAFKLTYLFVILSVYFMITIGPHQKYSRKYMRLYVATISTIEGVLLFRGASFIDNSVVMSPGFIEWMPAVCSIILIVTGIASLISFYLKKWENYQIIGSGAL